MTTVIETKELSKAYKGNEVVKKLNLKIKQNSIVGFLGPNGAGKTTVMKMLLGLTRPTSGSASVLGLDIEKQSIDLRKNVGYLPQDLHFYYHMTARETLRFLARFFYRGTHTAIEMRVQEMLDLVGLEDKADRPIKTFSGGEHQRLGIGQAQINYPKLLVLDEPAASLDPMGRRDVLNILNRLRKHTTIFYSTHILDDVQRVSDTVAIINHGELIALTKIETLQADKGEVVYSIGLKGEFFEVFKRVESQDWVRGIKEAKPSGRNQTNWQVSVSDENAAEAELLRLILADERVKVTAFDRKKLNLEEVFMNLVGDDDNGKK